VLLLPRLPIDEVLPEIVRGVGEAGAVVVRAPAGAGKTTRVPPALLDCGAVGEGCVVVLEPRRLAARAAARRMAAERGGSVGGEVGYHVRFDRKACAATRILVVTEGIFLRMIQDDPFLDGVGAVVFDEFHERSLDVDLALALAREVCRDARPDLAIAVMSATLETAPVAAFLGGCPVVESGGRLHEVAIDHDGTSPTDPLELRVARAVGGCLARTAGDLLVFLPGVGEIHRAERAIAASAAGRDLTILPLHGELTPAAQDAALRRGAARRVVLATNVAETSVTVEGVTAVVDTGLARRLRHDPSLGLNRLELGRISRASADQRAGRAGRTAPGVCVRLWSRVEHGALEAADIPEVRRLDLAGPVLQLHDWGRPDPAKFGWFELPSEAALDRAHHLLCRLGALDDRGVTELGRAMARLPAHPRLARLLVAGHRLGQTDRASAAAALLGERDPYRLRPDAKSRGRAVVCDLTERVEALEDRRATPPEGCVLVARDRGAVRFVRRVADQLARLTRRVCGREPPPRGNVDRALRHALLDAFPDRVARRRGARDPRAVMVGGRGVRLDRASGVEDAELFVCVQVDGGRSEGRVRLASAIEEGWLEPARIHVEDRIFFDADAERVRIVRRRCYEDLVLGEAAAGRSPATAGEVARVLAEAASDRLERALDLSGEATLAWRRRLRWLGQVRPDLPVHAPDDDDLRAALPELCRGLRSFRQLRELPLPTRLAARLDGAVLAALQREAPEHIRVPSGSLVRLRYRDDGPPVLPVRIQEMFGLADTPRVGSRNVKVLLELLAPNHRPQQVTDDLASFWRNTYPVVARELKRRYPRHAWPDDPLTARPERAPGPRKRP